MRKYTQSPFRQEPVAFELWPHLPPQVPGALIEADATRKMGAPSSPSSQSGATVSLRGGQAASFLISPHFTKTLFQAGMMKRSRTPFLHLTPICGTNSPPGIASLEYECPVSLIPPDLWAQGSAWGKARHEEEPSLPPARVWWYRGSSWGRREPKDGELTAVPEGAGFIGTGEHRELHA